MDVLTPKGQKALLDEKKAVKIFEDFHGKKFEYIPTDKKEPDDIDGFVRRRSDNKTVAVVEVKCRYDMTLEQFIKERRHEWLITLDKLQRCSTIAESMGVAFYGFLYIVDDNILLVVRIWKAGGFRVKMRTAKTKTKATMNGGEAIRVNAFVDVHGCSILFGK